RLYDGDGGAGVSAIRGKHFFDAAQKRRAFETEPAPSRRYDHRGRSGCAIEGADAAVYGRRYRSKRPSSTEVSPWPSRAARPSPSRIHSSPNRNPPASFHALFSARLSLRIQIRAVFSNNPNDVFEFFLD